MSKHRRNMFRAMVVLAAGAGVAGQALGQGYAGPVVSPTSLDFGNVTVGTTSATQTVTVSTPTTLGKTPINIVSITLPPGYVRVGGTCPASGSTNSPCTFGVAFAPGAVGAIGGNAVVTASVFGLLLAALMGTGFYFVRRR